MDNLDDIVALARHNARLSDGGLPGGDADAQLGRNPVSSPESRRTERLEVLDQQVAPRLLVLVARQLGTFEEGGGICLPGGERSKEPPPVPISLAQDIVA